MALPETFELITQAAAFPAGEQFRICRFFSYNCGIHLTIVDLRVSGCDFRVDNPSLSSKLDQANNISLKPVSMVGQPEGPE